MATLKQIGEIYNECLQAIRSQPLEGFDEEVTAWLKNARYQIMKDIEENFYLLEQSIHKPLLRPLWAIDPSEHLSIFTDTCPPIFKPYSEAIVSNLKQFMDDCGLNATVTCIEGHRMFYSIRLYFQFAYYHKATGMPEDGSLVVSDEFPSNPLWDISEPMQRLLIGRPTLDVGV